jgi:hypothetical protein
MDVSFTVGVDMTHCEAVTNLYLCLIEGNIYANFEIKCADGSYVARNSKQVA